ncbi:MULTISPECIES: hypothetical protein [Pseudomonas]|uniref:Uncharacterized protein n=1 Tax=Pseudomonas lutea TaxID=243924 RepID=A0A9X8MG97_9PSED|nr:MULTISPECIES: hypothetical protein [Pseudomonas]SER22150.1 hypothetical protein SAMN05216409_11465 [Pseudomonas lutea]
MPKLTKHVFIEKTEDGHKQQFESDIYASTDGEFSCTVPDYLVPALVAVGKRHKNPGQSRCTNKLKVNHRAYAASKADLISYVNEAHKDFYKAEVITDILICYDWFADVNYFVRPDGTICENGNAPGAGHGSGGGWAESKKRNASYMEHGQVNHFSVGVFAAVYKRKCFRRPSGETIKFERVFSESDIAPEMEWSRRLVGFCGLSQPRDPMNMASLPLNEGAARFFFDSMLAMCEIGRRFQYFFSNKERVEAAMNGNGISLLDKPIVA